MFNEDNGTGRCTMFTNGEDPSIFFDRPVSLIQDLYKNMIFEPIRFVGNESTTHCPIKSTKDMKNLFVGIDISKEKLNLCTRTSTEILYGDEIANTITAIRKHLKKLLKSADADQILVCAEYTGKYIFPLTCACHELSLFLWMEDPTRIKNSFGITRGKNDSVDAERIAEYAFRFNDKAVEYKMNDSAIASMKHLLSERDLVLTNKKTYQAQLDDDRNFMDKSEFQEKEKRFKKTIKAFQKQLDDIDEKIDSLINGDETIKHQMDLLTSVEGVGRVLAVNMITITEGFTRFKDARQFYCYAGLAPFQYTSGKSIYSKAKVSQRANKHIKSLLHMSALVAATRILSGDCKEYYERRKAEGKHPMCVLNVVRAKIVARMFAVIKRDTKYQKNHVTA